MSSQVPNIAAVLKGIASDVVTEERNINAPEHDEVLVRNHAIAINPIDWKRQAWGYKIPSYPVLLGSDIAGVIAKVGKSVKDFKPGDRVLGYSSAFLTGRSDCAAFQTYTIVKTFALTKLPESIGFKESATLPQGVGTAGLALFDVFGLPAPKGQRYTDASLSKSQNSILIWGAASSVGFITVQIARLIGLTVFAVASEPHHARLRSIGANMVFDYQSPTIVDDIVVSAKKIGKEINYAVDTISEQHTVSSVMKILKSGSRTRKFAYTAMWPKDEPDVDGIWTKHIPGEDIQDRRADLCAFLFNEALPKWLQDGEIEPIPHQTVEGGISGIQKAMETLKAGVHMKKIVVEL